MADPNGSQEFEITKGDLDKAPPRILAFLTALVEATEPLRKCIIEELPAPPGTDPDYSKDRVCISIVSFLLPIIVSAIVWCVTSGAAFSSESPSYVWRFCYCFLAGFLGLAVRAFHLRKSCKRDSPWPDYITIYPMALLMNGSAVFTLLTLFENKLKDLFWTAAFPLSMVLGLYCHPEVWILTRLIGKWKQG